MWIEKERDLKKVLKKMQKKVLPNSPQVEN